MKKRIGIIALVLLVFAACAVADFRSDEDPTWVILTDTAYTLRGGEWNIDLFGAVTYGIIDGLHAQTNLLIWAFQIPNIQLKWNLLPDSGSMPAIALGGTFGLFNAKNGADSLTLLIWNASAYISKKLGDSIWLSGSYTYNRFNITGTLSGSSFDLSSMFSTWTGTSDPTGISNATLSFVYQLSPGARLCIESTALIGQTVNFSVIPGVAWAFGENFRLKLFVFTAISSQPVYFPMVNLAWKIK